MLFVCRYADATVVHINTVTSHERGIRYMSTSIVHTRAKVEELSAVRIGFRSGVSSVSVAGCGMEY